MVLHVTLTHPWNVLSAQRRFPKGRDLVKIPEMKRKQVKDDGNMEDSRRNANTLWSFGSDVALITGRSVGLHMPKQSKKVFWESWKRRLPCMTFTLLSQLVDSNATCVLPNRLYFSPWGRHEARCCPPSTTSFGLQKLSSMQHWPFESGQIVQIVQMSSSELKYVELSHWDILCHKFASTNCAEGLSGQDLSGVKEPRKWTAERMLTPNTQLLPEVIPDMIPISLHTFYCIAFCFVLFSSINSAWMLISFSMMLILRKRWEDMK